MNSIVDIFNKEETVKRYKKLRQFIMENEKCLSELKIKLSHREAKYTDFKYEIIIDEYLELENEVKNDLEMIKAILENGIKDDFAE